MKRDQPFTFEEFKSIYSKVPRLCVDLVIKTPKGVLLTFRTKNGYHNQWHLPGGTVYFREKVENAVKRVAKEELGIKIVIKKFLGYLEYPSEIKERGFGYTISLVFLCKPINMKIKLDDQVEKAEIFKVVPTDTISEQKSILKKILR